MKFRIGIIAVVFFIFGCSKTPPAFLYPIQQNGRWGFIDSAGVVVIEPIFFEIRPFKSGIAWVKTDTTNWTLIDVFGRPVLKETFETIEELPTRNAVRLVYTSMLGGLSYSHHPQFIESKDSSSYKIGRGGKFGLVSNSGKLISPPQFDDVGRLSDNKAWFRSDSLFGFIDTNGTVIIPAQFDTVSDFSWGIAWAFKNGEWKTINNTGAAGVEIFGHDGQQIPAIITVTPFYNGWATIQTKLVTLGPLWSPMPRIIFDWFSVDTAGRRALINPGNFAMAYDWKLSQYTHSEIGPTDGVLLVTENRLYHPNKRSINLKDYINVFRISDRLIGVTHPYNYRRWSILRLYPDSLGSPSWQEYEHEIQEFSEGVALVCKREWMYVTAADPNKYIPPIPINHWGFIDTTGQFLRQPDFRCDQVYPFQNGIAVFKRGTLYGVVDKVFNEIVKPEYENLRRNGSLWIYQLEKKYGLMNERFEKITPNEFDTVESFKGPLARYVKNGKWGYINRQGKSVWESNL